MLLKKWVLAALKKQYSRTMREAYAFARDSACAPEVTNVLDCGSDNGYERLETFGLHPMSDERFRYSGLEWNELAVEQGRSQGLDIVQADLNRALPVESGSKDCVIAFSVLEHLLMPCAFLAECHRVLEPGGRLVVLTPNISTYFTALQILRGKMPSSGPHPDSNSLIEAEQPGDISGLLRDDVSGETPQHRHLVVFSFQVLRNFLQSAGFMIEEARGFGYYPLPMILQPMFERLDSGHCHQMVFVCSRAR